MIVKYLHTILNCIQNTVILLIMDYIRKLPLGIYIYDL